MQREQPQPHVIIVKQESTWVRRFLLFWLFGLWYPLFVLCRWCVVTAWRLFVAYPVKWTITGAQWFHSRYSWRGWAILSAVVVALAIISKITGA